MTIYVTATDPEATRKYGKIYKIMYECADMEEANSVEHNIIYSGLKYIYKAKVKPKYSERYYILEYRNKKQFPIMYKDMRIKI